MKLFNTNKFALRTITSDLKLRQNRFCLFGVRVVAILIVAGMSLAGSSYAAPDDLVVEFESTPLFSEANFLPGNEVVRYAKVTNNTGALKDIIAEAINVSDPDSFADALTLVIKEGATELFNGSLADFFDAGEVALSAVAGGGGTTQYDFNVVFNSSSGNSYQENILGFDIIIGFAGEGGGEEGGGGGGGGGGGSGISGGLSILNETVEILDVETTSVTIIWDTSYRSTSRVVYGTSPGLFDFNSSPNYGYPFSTVEENTPASSNGVFNHSVTISGLTPGTTYYFRTISHASPDSLSFEHSFLTLGSPPSGGQSDSNDGAVAGAINLGASSGSTVSDGESIDDHLAVGGGRDRDQDQGGQPPISPSTIADETEEDNEADKELSNNNLAASVGSLFGSLGPWWLWLIIILIIVLVIYFSRRKKNQLESQQ